MEINRGKKTIRLTTDLMELLKQEADKDGYSITELIIFILWEYFGNIHQG